MEHFVNVPSKSNTRARTTLGFVVVLMMLGRGDAEAAAAAAAFAAAEEVTIVATDVGAFLMLGRKREPEIELQSPPVPWRARRAAARNEWSCRRAARDTTSRGMQASNGPIVEAPGERFLIFHTLFSLSHLRRFAEGAAAALVLLVAAAPAGLLTAFLFRAVAVVVVAGGFCCF